MASVDETLEPLKTQWHTLPEIVDYLANPASRHQNNRTVLNLAKKENKEVLHSTQRHLENLGFRKFKFYNAGNIRSCLFSTEGQIVKISAYASSNQDRPAHPIVLKPIYSGGFPTNEFHVGIQVYPIIETSLSLNYDEINRLTKLINASGIGFTDARKENFGHLTFEGKTLHFVIDDDSLSETNNGQANNGETKHLIKAGYLVEHDDELVEVQKLFDPRIGTGSPTGVITETERERLAEILSNPPGSPKRKSALAEAIEIGGLYAGEVPDLLTKADGLKGLWEKRLAETAKALGPKSKI